MKILDKIALVLFSIIMIIIAMIICFTIFGWVDVTTLYLLIINSLHNKTVCNVLLIVNIVFLLLAIKAIFFGTFTSDKDNYNDGILLENDDGKLLITKDTLVSMVNVVVAGFDSVEDYQTKVYLDNENNLSIALTIETTSNTIIKELSNNLQLRIKEKIKESLDLDVKNIDIRIKNVISIKEENTKE